MTYQAFENAAGFWEIWNIKTNKLAIGNIWHKSDAIRICNKMNN